MDGDGRVYHRTKYIGTGFNFLVLGGVLVTIGYGEYLCALRKVGDDEDEEDKEEEDEEKSRHCGYPPFVAQAIFW